MGRNWVNLKKHREGCLNQKGTVRFPAILVILILNLEAGRREEEVGSKGKGITDRGTESTWNNRRVRGQVQNDRNEGDCETFGLERQAGMCLWKDLNLILKIRDPWYNFKQKCDSLRFRNIIAGVNKSVPTKLVIFEGELRKTPKNVVGNIRKRETVHFPYLQSLCGYQSRTNLVVK